MKDAPPLEDDMIPTERVAVVVYLLCHGHKFRTSDVAVIGGITRQGAHAMLAKISRKIPLAGPESGGNRWYIIEEDDDEPAAQSNKG